MKYLINFLMDTPDDNPFNQFIGKEVKIQTKYNLMSGKKSFSGFNTIAGKLTKANDKFIFIETNDKIIAIDNKSIICIEMEKDKK